MTQSEAHFFLINSIELKNKVIAHTEKLDIHLIITEIIHIVTLNKIALRKESPWT